MDLCPVCSRFIGDCEPNLQKVMVLELISTMDPVNSNKPILKSWEVGEYLDPTR